ncbi:MAG: hypothetical protein A3C44_02135 [Gammaproteobacteria bacterium RIFCSPHIGHO2_02_FULL_39_13]|nr:MAG: hypothetical protein A3C44_02135 [Gammaproteobacteria bacterium RIFCSPHIGHO2_02_FULL_39_13]OGT48335.1 MAG: hypothetical protein A3E53_05830 [Gammaproteobacteria bacterium RIFCSPHIGHO2_12_FULL_39_24]
MPRRKKHPSKEIEAAVITAEKNGWVYKKTSGSAHAWGRLFCSLRTQDGCILSIWSTPRSNEVHAKQIRARVKKCPHLSREK